MKKSILLIALLLLAACASPQKIISDAASKCPQIGINIDQPDFYQKHNRQEVEEFYSCMTTELQPGTKIPVFGHAGSPGRRLLSALNQNSDIKTSIQPALEYQKNLWQQVCDTEMKPGAAQENWIKWMQNERQINAINAAASDTTAAINDAARQQNLQLMQIQQQQFMQNSMMQNGR